MSKLRFALSNFFGRITCKWRALVLGALIALTMGFSIWLVSDEDKKTRMEGFALGGTVIGMLCIALVVCRK